MWYWGNGGHWWWMLMGMVVMVAFWGIIIWAIWYFVTSFSRQPDQGDRSDDSERILKHILDERLARGEIDTEEYGRLRDVMTSGAAPTANGQRVGAASSGGQR
jgi:putative membrane protein